VTKAKTKCCTKETKSQLGQGIFYGILPHTFCIAFIVFSVIGATAFTSIFKSLLINIYFFPSLILLSFVLATLSAVIYLKRGEGLSIKSVINNKNYLLILYSSIIGVNLLLFLVVFPLASNSSFTNKISLTTANQISEMISVDIPCSGMPP